MTAVLQGLGTAVPPRVVTNDDLSKVLATSDEWIRTRTGIAQRHVADPEGSTSDLAVEAGANALKAAGGEVDLVMVATTTPDHTCPSTAPEVAARLGLGTIGAFDVNAVCAGFVYGLATASSLIDSGVANRVLVIGAETMTRIVDPTDRGTAVLFGDGAGAVVVGRGEPGEHGALGPFDLGSDGEQLGLLCVPAGGSRRPLDAEGIAERANYLKMDGREVYRQAVSRMAESSRALLARADLDVDDIDWFVGHQANARILDAVANRLGVAPERRFSNVARYGNTSAASIPLALGDAHIEPGQRVLLTSFGAGMTWGSALLTWPNLARA
jgi:3-oxoacyl-[acyl-carrier-protein] synthase III